MRFKPSIPRRGYRRRSSGVQVDLLELLLGFLLEIFLEFVVEVVAEAIIVFLLTIVSEAISPDELRRPVMAGLGYLFLGSVIGGLSLVWFPVPLIHPSRFHGIGLIVSPVLAGLLMSLLAPDSQACVGLEISEGL